MDGLRTLIFDVSDLVAAKAFYAEVLGKPPYFDEPFYVGFDVAGYELGLRPAEGERQPGAGGSTAYLGTHDVDGEVARIVALGASVREAPEEVGGGIRVATIRDPFGNVLGLIRNPEFAPPLTFAGASDLSPREIRHERVIPLPRRDVWPLWSSAEGMTRWLVTSAKIDLRPGGLYEIHFMPEAPSGARGSETCRVLSFLPERMISFTWNAPPHLDRTRPLHTWVVVELADAEAGTRVSVTHCGWPARGLAEDEQWEATYAYFDRAWAGVLSALDGYARTGKRAD
jgi:uncharacterized protein YndB with AHSA1/START domain/predicted enzyme related to lactoylglutathione lyase